MACSAYLSLALHVLSSWRPNCTLMRSSCEIHICSKIDRDYFLPTIFVCYKGSFHLRNYHYCSVRYKKSKVFCGQEPNSGESTTTEYTEVLQWGTPSCSRPQPATNNSVKDGRSNWLVAPHSHGQYPLSSTYCMVLTPPTNHKTLLHQPRLEPASTGMTDQRTACQGIVFYVFTSFTQLVSSILTRALLDIYTSCFWFVSAGCLHIVQFKPFLRIAWVYIKTYMCSFSLILCRGPVAT